MFILLGREERSWTPSAIALELRTSTEGAAQIVAELTERGMARQLPAGYAIADALDVRSAARDLGALFATQRMSIVNRIYQPRPKAAPSDPVRELADAFRIKKKDDDRG